RPARSSARDLEYTRSGTPSTYRHVLRPSGLHQTLGTVRPEEYRDVVRAYQRVCTEVIQRYDGHIAQLLGDGLLVYFGYPQAHEDDAHRAARTGLGILDAMEDLRTRLKQEKGIELAVRVDIH